MTATLAASLTGQCNINLLDKVFPSFWSQVKQLINKTEKLSLYVPKGLWPKAQRRAKFKFSVKNFLKTHNAPLHFRGIDPPLIDATKGMI